jgi:hypothetical protein
MLCISSSNLYFCHCTFTHIFYVTSTIWFWLDCYLFALIAFHFQLPNHLSCAWIYYTHGIWCLTMLVVIYLYWKRLLMFPKQKYCCRWHISGAWCHLVFGVHEPISWSAHMLRWNSEEPLAGPKSIPFLHSPLTIRQAHIHHIPLNLPVPCCFTLLGAAEESSILVYKLHFGMGRREALKDQYCLRPT